ncbi:MAG: YbhB/YbcL family Raf kinase inhibitor-like protein [Proteobacteria bacterium]|nr:YbhB/YbcL family Raf kinase inhibitor-like protein [Pseudomonadota bacterium]MDE3207544.1 YbhB/YbcL family Raf kinase inhibitor-like protein [Pseudomonadota bacterium]
MIKVLIILILFMLSGPAYSLDFFSPGIPSGTKIRKDYVMNHDGCKGKNLSPELRWNTPPAGVKSYAVSVYDLDAPGGWWHWLIYDIPANVTRLPVNSGYSENGIGPFGTHEGINDYGTYGWGGPCPPAGDLPHHYLFTLYALGIKKLPLPSESKIEDIIPLIKKDSIDSISFTAYYGRK